MMYETLYSEFKNAIPESVPFLEQAEKMYDLDESDGQHVLFGLAIERYVYDRLLEKDIETIQKIASFIEEMETASDERIVDVIEQTVIEHLISSVTGRINYKKRFNVWKDSIIYILNEFYTDND